MPQGQLVLMHTACITPSPGQVLSTAIPEWMPPSNSSHHKILPCYSGVL